MAVLKKVSGSDMAVFGVKEVQRLTGFSRTSAVNLLTSLAKKGLVVNLLRDRYCLAEAPAENGFAVATGAFMPSYVSFWSALSFYGFTEQQPRVVQIASTKQFKGVELKQISIKPITIKPRNFFGYALEPGFPVALREKALIDSALNPEQAGGFSEFVKCFRNAWGEIDKERFFKFLFRTNNRSLNSRVGYMIEELGLPAENRFMRMLRKNASKGFVKLNPSKKKAKKYNKDWRLIVNDSVKQGAVL